MARNIKRNLTHSQTSALQGALKTLGYNVGKVDGAYGNKTQGAVNSAYKALGLTPWTGGGISKEGYNKIIAEANKVKAPKPYTTPKTQFAWTPNSNNYGNYASIGKAEAMLTGGEFDPNTYSYNRSNWAGSEGLKALMYGNNKNYKAKGMTKKDMAMINYYAAQYDDLQRQKLLEAEQRNQDALTQMEAMQGQLQQFNDVDEIYRQSIAMQQQMYENQRAQREAEIAETVNSIRGNQDIINKNFEDAQKEAYITNMMEKNGLDDYLSLKGYTGGSSESIASQMAANYQNNREKAVVERDNAVRQNERLAAEAQMSGNRDLANMASSATSDYINALKEQAGMNLQIAQANRAQSNADRDFEFNKMQADRNFQMNQENLKREDERYNDGLKREKAQADMQAFLNTYQGKYSKKSTYEKWIKNLERMPDPYGYNRQKVAYLRQYMNQMYNPAYASLIESKMPQSTSGRSGSGGRGRSRGRSRSGARGANLAEAETELKRNQATLYKNLMGDITLGGDFKNPYSISDFYAKKMDEIKSAYESKAITQKQAKRLIAEMQKRAQKVNFGTVPQDLGF